MKGGVFLFAAVLLAVVAFVSAPVGAQQSIAPQCPTHPEPYCPNGHVVPGGTGLNDCPMPKKCVVEVPRALTEGQCLRLKGVMADSQQKLVVARQQVTQMLAARPTGWNVGTTGVWQQAIEAYMQKDFWPVAQTAHQAEYDFYHTHRCAPAPGVAGF